jgi:transposase
LRKAREPRGPTARSGSSAPAAEPVGSGAPQKRAGSHPARPDRVTGHRIRLRQCHARSSREAHAAGPGDLRQELSGIALKVWFLAKEHPGCSRLMTKPGVGEVVALTFCSAADDSVWFASSWNVGAWGGLTLTRH